MDNELVYNMCKNYVKEYEKEQKWLEYEESIDTDFDITSNEWVNETEEVEPSQYGVWKAGLQSTIVDKYVRQLPAPLQNKILLTCVNMKAGNTTHKKYNMNYKDFDKLLYRNCQDYMVAYEAYSYKETKKAYKKRLQKLIINDFIRMLPIELQKKIIHDAYQKIEAKINFRSANEQSIEQSIEQFVNRAFKQYRRAEKWQN